MTQTKLKVVDSNSTNKMDKENRTTVITTSASTLTQTESAATSPVAIRETRSDSAVNVRMPTPNKATNKNKMSPW